MPVVTSAAIAGAALGSGGLIGGALAGGAAYALGEAVGYSPIDTYESIGDMFKGPEIPDAPKQEAPVDSGDEGIRRGAMARQSKRRALGQIHLTRGQERGSGLELGGQRELLG